ncbi:hypothetical protein B484DRAFT_465923 [Ochromonadaceae sp. CCMP2298]|nr:hypothetical protein B484DRAFT_465923 [Ochromonadaceae sp. CCMP2298]
MKALETAAKAMLLQESFEGWTHEAMDRLLRLQLIKELVSVAKVFNRPSTSLSDRTWQQENAEALLEISHAAHTEDAAIGESGEGGKAGTAGGSKRKADEDATPGGASSKYKNAADLRVEAKAGGGPRASAEDPYLEQLGGVSQYLQNRGKQEEKLANKEKATTAFEAIVKPESYKDGDKGQFWTRRLLGLGVDTPAAMEELCSLEEDEAREALEGVQKDLKLVPASALRKYRESVAVITPARQG